MMNIGKRLRGYSRPLGFLILGLALAIGLIFSSQTQVARAVTLTVSNSGTDNIACGDVATPCQTIGYALANRANNTDTISVVAGTYPENLTINKSVTLNGPNFNINPYNGTRLPEAIISGGVRWQVAANNVTIQGFSFENITAAGGNGVIEASVASNSGTVARNRFISAGLSAISLNTTARNSWTITENLVDGVSGSSPALSISQVATATVTLNVIRNTSNAGIQLGNGVSAATVTNNQIAFPQPPVTPVLGQDGIRLLGTSSYSGTLLIENNVVNYAYNGVAVGGGEDITGKDIRFNRNCVSGSGNAGGNNGGTGTLNATNNWWNPNVFVGTLNTNPSISSLIAGSISILPNASVNYTARVIGASPGSGMLVSYLISPTPGANPASGTVATDGGGNVTIALTNVPAGNYTVSFNPNNGSFPFNRTGCMTGNGTLKSTTPASVAVDTGSPQSATVNTAFAAPLRAVVRDGSNNPGSPISGVSVTFTAPNSGQSGLFTGGLISVTVQTDLSGKAQTPTFTANTVAGQYNVVATVNNYPAAGSANFVLTNTPGAPASITAFAGTPQNTPVGTAYPTNLVALVKDSFQNPVGGATVTFAAPGSGPSGNFPGNVGSVNTTTQADGKATAPIFTANGQNGSFNVTASVLGSPGAGTATFVLTNGVGSPATITATSGTPQTGQFNQPFGLPFEATVKDSFGNLVVGANVTFTAPNSGASGTFPGSQLTAQATTDSSGKATSPIFTANATAGAYIVTATVNGFAGAGTAQFHLTNSSTGCLNTYTVIINTDNGAGDCGTLSYAINQAKASTQPITISFSVSQIDVSGALPPVNNLNGVTVKLDGGCTTTNGRGVPGVWLKANAGLSLPGLKLINKTTIRGLKFTGFGDYAINVQGSNNNIVCNWIGTSNGTTATANGGGIQLGTVGGPSANNNSIGLTNDPSSGNLISGNTASGVLVNKGTNNQMYNTWIGLQNDGLTLLRNGDTALKILVGGQLKLYQGNRVR